MSSRLPTSAQRTIHPRLDEVVERHLQNHWAQPIHDHTQKAFDRIDRHIKDHARPIILDAGCGTGWASRWLAESFPNHWVIGIDRSTDRLNRAPKSPENVLLVRAELGDFWRLVRQSDWPVERHYVLYPNPYPKATHLKKRWHGHPVWPDLLQVGTELILRTNSKLYAQEWAQALAIAGQEHIRSNVLTPQEVEASPMSAFEKKYGRSGHVLYEVTSHRAHRFVIDGSSS